MHSKKTLHQLKNEYKKVLKNLEELKQKKGFLGKSHQVEALSKEKQNLQEQIKRPCLHTQVLEICQGKGCVKTKKPLLIRVCIFCEIYEQAPCFKKTKNSTVIRKISEDMLW